MMNAFTESDNQFKLEKTSYLTVGGVVRNCLQFLPAQKTSPMQTLVLGDSRGVIYLTQYKKTEPEILLKTNPFSREIAHIQCVTGGGRERIFFAVSNSVFVINRNNSDRYKIEFDIADNISSFQVIENNIWTISNSYLSQYEYGDMTVEKGTFDNEYKIMALFTSQFFGQSDIVVLIGSEDSKIKVIEKCEEVLIALPTSGAPSCFCLLKLSSYDNSDNNVLYGTTTGTLGILNIIDKNTFKILWEIDAKVNLSEIVTIKVFDINTDGANEIIIIRTNGFIDIYSIDDTLTNVSLICRQETGEHLTGLEIGKFKSEQYELMLTSLTGLVFSFMPELNLGKTKTKVLDKKNLNKIMAETEKEVQALNNLLAKNKEEYEKPQNSNYNPTSKNSFKLNIRFTLIPRESVFQLLLDSEFPIEMVLLHCTRARLDILDVKTKDVLLNILEKETMDEETNLHTQFMATFKLKEASHNLEIIVRTYEGISDQISATVIPLNKPKTAQIVQVPIYALSFHKKYEPEYEKDIGEVIALDDDRIINVLIIEGMTSNELNQILHLIIPNIPAILKGDSSKYVLRSTFINTLVEISIGKSRTEIRSIFLSTLMTLKEQITIEANTRKKEIQFKVQFKPLSIYKILEILNPKIEQIFNLEMKYKMLQAFKELGDSVSFGDLPEEYQKIMSMNDEIVSEYSKRTINLKYFKSLTEQLLNDIRKVITVNDFAGRLSDIEKVFDDYSYEKIKTIFNIVN